MVVVNQIEKIKEKLRIYRKPFIDQILLNELLETFAPNYTISQLTSRKLITTIRKWKIYLNELYDKNIILLGTTILSQYYQWEKYYAVWWLYIYNKYWYTTQVANKITVYNLKISWEKTIAWQKFIFKKERENFFYWIEGKDAQGYWKYNCFSRERALIQLLKERKWKLEFAEDIYELIKKWEIDVDKLRNLAVKYSSHQTQILLQNFLKEWKILTK